MIFARLLRDGVRSGAITCSVRIWQSARVKVGGLYRMEPGHIRVTSIREIVLDDVTDELARRSGFAGVNDLLETARHGRGSNVYLVEFEYIASEDRSG